MDTIRSASLRSVVSPTPTKLILKLFCLLILSEGSLHVIAPLIFSLKDQLGTCLCRTKLTDDESHCSILTCEDPHCQSQVGLLSHDSVCGSVPHHDGVPRTHSQLITDEESVVRIRFGDGVSVITTQHQVNQAAERECGQELFCSFSRV